MATNNVQKAAMLIGFALRRPMPNPTPGSIYSELIDSYHSNDEFRQNTEDIANGLGLHVMDVNHRGIFLRTNGEDSPFRAKLEHINTSLLSPDLRQIFGMALTTVAALFYQSPSQLHEDMAPTLTVRAAREELINIAKARVEEVSKGDEDHSDIDEACASILKHSATISTPGGGHSYKTVHKLMELAFKFLEDEGFITKRKEEEGAYTAFTKFRIHMKEFMALESYHTVTRILKEQEKDALAKQESDHA